MRPFHILLTVILMLVWGCNFIFIQFGLIDIPPLFLCAIRFFLASIPLVFFIKPPAIPFKIVILYGFFTFALQFGLLFIGMHAGMKAGFTSLILQVQIFFSILLAAFFLKEIPNIWQIIGALIAFSGTVVAAFNLENNVSLVGFILVVAAAAAWGIGNLISKKMPQVNMMSLVAWSSLVACPGLFLLSLVFEGPSRMSYSFHHISWLMIVSVAYIVYGSTWFGYGVWNWLLSQYPVATVAPFTLLVPVFGVISSILVFDEPMQPWKILAGVLVLLGLCINLFGSRFTIKP